MIQIKKLTYLLTIILFSNYLSAQERTNPTNQSEELGKVHWYRNYDEAITMAKKEQKDIVILFQEVPGCATCRNYGHNVLSHPLMVEALENSFIPLAIYNNKEGEDKKVLDKFNERTWNNPVIRIIDANGKNIVKRISNDYTALTLSKKLKETLAIRNTPSPLYLDLLEDELSAADSKYINEVNYQMYCFWTGEKQLGKIEGVVDVEAGFINHNEVVKVKYNSNLVSESEITAYAKKQNFTPINTSPNYKTATKDVHYYLSHSIYKFLPLSSIQKTKINSALGSNQSALKYLSPQQRKWLHFINNNSAKKYNSLLAIPEIEDAWELMTKNYQL